MVGQLASRARRAPLQHCEVQDGSLCGGAYLAKPDSAKSESAVQERAKPYFAKPGN